MSNYFIQVLRLPIKIGTGCRAFTFSLQLENVNKKSRRCCPMTLNDSTPAERKELAALKQLFFLIASIPPFLTLLVRGGCSD